MGLVSHSYCRLILTQYVSQVNRKGRILRAAYQCLKSLKPIFHWKLGLRWQMKSTQKHEMYMANAKILRLEPNATYIPLTCVWVSRWGNANFRFGIGCFRVFRYQHVGIPNAKFSHWGCYPTPDPNTKSFVSQWNIGFTRSEIYFFAFFKTFKILIF